MKTKRRKKYNKKSYNKKTFRKNFNKKKFKKKSYRKSYRRIRNKIYIGGAKVRINFELIISFLTENINAAQRNTDLNKYYEHDYVNRAITKINNFIRNLPTYISEATNPVNRPYILENSVEFGETMLATERLNMEEIKFFKSPHDVNIIQKLNELINLLEEDKRDIINSTIIFLFCNINDKDLQKALNKIKYYHEKMQTYVDDFIYICKLVIIKHFYYNIRNNCATLNQSNIDFNKTLREIFDLNSIIINFLKFNYRENSEYKYLNTIIELTTLFDSKNILINYIFSEDDTIILNENNNIDNTIEFLRRYEEKTLIRYKCDYIIYRIIRIRIPSDSTPKPFPEIIDNLQNTIFTRINLKTLLGDPNNISQLFDGSIILNLNVGQETIRCAYYYKSLIYLINLFIKDNYYDFMVKYQFEYKKGGNLSKLRSLRRDLNNLEKEKERRKSVKQIVINGIEEKKNSVIEEYQKFERDVNQKIREIQAEIESLNKEEIGRSNILNAKKDIMLELLYIIDAYNFFKHHDNPSYNSRLQSWQDDKVEKINLKIRDEDESKD